MFVRKLDQTKRLQLARLTLKDSKSLTKIASNHGVSRKFLNQQKARANQALDQAFAEPIYEKPLFWLPVTKSWLNQFVLCLLLHCIVVIAASSKLWPTFLIFRFH